MHGRTSRHDGGRSARQRGIALPTVLFMGVVLFLIVVAVAFRGVVGVNQANDQRRYNEALHTADGGVDKVLFELTEDHDYVTQTPPTGGGTPADDAPPAPGADERTWALGKAAAKLPVSSGSDPLLTKLVKARGGEWAVVKPTGEALVYAVGYVPTRANATRTRVLRVEYDFPPFSAVNAILTGGNLRIGGNAQISGSAGSIHTNGNFAWTGNSWGVQGHVSASGTFPSGSLPGNIGNPGGSGGGQPTQFIPDIEAADSYGLSMYDLCPDGTAHAGPKHPTQPNATGTPCGGAALPFTSSFMGWTRNVGAGAGLTSPTQWRYQSSACNPGVYYVHLGTVRIQGNPGTDAFTCGGQPWAVTILVSAMHSGAAGTCPHYGGDIDIQGTPKMRPHSSAGGILFVAGRDFQMQGNASGGGAQLQGAISVHEQFNVTGNMTLFGNIIANDLCDTSGSPISQNIINLQGSSSITFNSPVELPLGKLVRITRWTEL